jgi:hypothetical protein
MAAGSISEKILNKIKEKSPSPEVKDFLIDLVYYEVDNPRMFKEHYLKQVELYSRKG